MQNENFICDGRTFLYLNKTSENHFCSHFASINGHIRRSFDDLGHKGREEEARALATSEIRILDVKAKMAKHKQDGNERKRRKLHGHERSENQSRAKRKIFLVASSSDEKRFSDCEMKISVLFLFFFSTRLA
jgi:hypothetical protein